MARIAARLRHSLTSCSRAVLVAALVFPAWTAAASASTITYAGSLTDLGSGWRTASVSKGAFSTTGILGGDGYYIVGNQQQSLMPTYVSSFYENGNTYGGNGSYASIDNPATTPGASPTLLTTGTFNQAVGAGNPGIPLSFTLTGTVPSTIQVGLLVDNTDGVEWNDYDIQLSSSISGAGPEVSLTGSAYNDRIPDWVFFDVSGAVSGETISVVAYAGSGGHVELGGVSFDSTDAPEPATLALLGSGLLGIAASRRRRDRRG